eukprot:gene9826-2019_t
MICRYFTGAAADYRKMVASDDDDNGTDSSSSHRKESDSSQKEQWEEDQEGWSMFLDKKNELFAAQQDYVTTHPELKHLISDFLQYILVRKPENVHEAASIYFSQFREDEDSGTTE